jgi:flagellar basal-body rod protein FlgB
LWWWRRFSSGGGPASFAGTAARLAAALPKSPYLPVAEGISGCGMVGALSSSEQPIQAIQHNMNDRFGEHLTVQRSALNILVQRQEMIASNIANADTPHYKARDIDFKEALANQLAGRREQNLSLARTSRGHIGGAAEASLPASMKYRNEFQPGVDGNTVNMDVERAAFAETALRLEAALTFVRGSLRDLQSAMSQ